MKSPAGPRRPHITWRELTFDEHCTIKTCILFFFDRGVCAWETVRGGGQDGWIHVLPLMVALGFTLFLRLPCRDHSNVSGQRTRHPIRIRWKCSSHTCKKACFPNDFQGFTITVRFPRRRRGTQRTAPYCSCPDMKNIHFPMIPKVCHCDLWARRGGAHRFSSWHSPSRLLETFIFTRFSKDFQ